MISWPFPCTFPDFCSLWGRVSVAKQLLPCYLSQVVLSSPWKPQRDPRGNISHRSVTLVCITKHFQEEN